MLPTDPIRVLHHSAFNAKPFGHGGERRTAQIIELLKKNNVEIESLDWKHSDSKSGFYKFVRIPLYLWYFLKFCLEARIAIFPSKNDVLFIGFSYNYFVTKVKPLLKNRFDAFIWESTYDQYYILPFLLRKQGLRIISLPHNIESLVPKRKSFLYKKIAPKWLTEEINLLKIADKAFTISREEEWLLNLHGVSSHYLPYVPVKEVVSYFFEIKQNRVGNGNFLLIGTATNPPTYLGMKRLINELDGHIGAARIDIAGYGTERLKAEFPSLENFNVLGTLTDEEMRRNLTECKAVLVNNEPSSGVLTKIIELALSAVPVILDVGSARSYFHLDCLSIYNDMAELKEILYNYNNTELAIGCDLGNESAFFDFEKYFINSIKS